MEIYEFPANSFHQNHDDHGNNFSTMISSNPLFSSIITLYLLILLYFPHLFLSLLLSPLFFYTLILPLYLLRFCVSQQTHRAKKAGPGTDPENVEVDCNAEADSHCKEAPIEPEPPQQEHSETETDRTLSQQDEEAERPKSETTDDPKHKQEQSGRCYLTRPELICRENFVESDVGAPLEVIYEAYEGEEEGDEDQNDALKEDCTVRLDRYPSILPYYLESDSDSESDSGSSSISWDGEFQGIHKWDGEEEEKEGLIEIEIDHADDNHNDKRMKKPLELSQMDEEDNLIEIDISLLRNDDGCSW